MGGTAVVVGVGLAVALLVLLLLAVSVSWLGELGIGRDVVVAGLRGTVQLAAVALVIVAVVRSLWLTAAFVTVMFGVAARTAARRMTRHRSGWSAAFPIAAGVAPVLVVVLLSGAVPPTGIAIVPVAGIVIGGAMTATSLAGRRALDELEARRDEYEAALALGARRRVAAMLVCRPSAAQAMVPPLDQTRTVGLVTLPGAFVGVLLGSGNPVQAAAAQLLVLIGLLAAESVAVVVVVELVARHCVYRGHS
jgi:putative ABC transport system permease protein